MIKIYSLHNYPGKDTLNFREGIINSIHVDVSGNPHHY
jgi:hypothetical protein